MLFSVAQTLEIIVIIFWFRMLRPIGFQPGAGVCIHRILEICSAMWQGSRAVVAPRGQISLALGGKGLEKRFGTTSPTHQIFVVCHLAMTHFSAYLTCDGYSVQWKSIRWIVIVFCRHQKWIMLK